MTVKKKPIDKVRASRDGHEYHEIWVARKSLQLLNPASDLVVLAVEGLTPVDQKNAKSEEVEIADVTLYFGGKDFNSSKQISILQFKYSIAYKNNSFKAADAKKTIEKFATTYKGHVKRFGKNAPQKLRFQLITNRPMYADFIKSISNLAAGIKNKNKLLAQEKQFKAAAKLTGDQLKEFASCCEFLSYTKLLSNSKRELESTLISLSATSDSIASSRLGKLKELVREKAGSAGDNRNTIERTDVLAALSVRDVNDLLPCPEALSDWGDTLAREQTEAAIKTIASSDKTILIHAAGGVGKTVFMKSLANKLSEEHEVVFFDSFGGGAYRSTEDARHLAKHGIIHIANTLAFRGLCDPILPNTPDEQALAQTFRHRLDQCLGTIKRNHSGRKIYLFIDAIDNAEFAAKQNGERAFSKILLESFHDKPIKGVKLIVTCRTERKPSTYAKYTEFELKAFTKAEASEFLNNRIKNLSGVFIDTAYSRSGGNARVLDYLLQSKNQDVNDKSKLQLDDLLTQKIEKAIENATQRGSSENDLTTFLSGLTLLAPPVRIEDYALANKVDSAAIESMISDLAPLLEQSKYGVMFKDEPTETLIIKKYGSKTDDLKKIASSLSAAQDQSVFAAKTLPDLLYKLQDGDSIYSLASDSRIPSSIESDVGKLRIRYARLKVAAKYASDKKDYDKLIGFLVELSSIAEFDQRGLGYLLKYPELVVQSKDSDAIRRIYESRTEWPGTRHARLGIIHVLRGDLEEAHGHIFSLNEWINHYLRIDQNSRFKFKSRMTATDCVAEPLFLLANKVPMNAARSVSRWKEWYSFEIATRLYRYLPLAVEKGIINSKDIATFHGELKSVGTLLAALFFYDFSKKEKSSLLKKIASLLKNKNIEFPDILNPGNDFLFQKCFLYASLNSFIEGDEKSAATILEALGNKRPRIYAFKDHYYHNSFPVEFLLREVIRSIITGKEISLVDILPDELFAFGKNIIKKTDSEFLKELKDKIENNLKISKDDPNRIIRDSDKGEVDEFINNRLPQLYSLATSIRNLLNPSKGKIKPRLGGLIDIWEKITKNQNIYRSGQIDHLWLLFGYEVIIFALFALRNVKPDDIESLLSSPNFQNISVGTRVGMVHALSTLFPSEDLAARVASELATQVTAENDVTTRASIFADISQVLLPVNKDESIEYFKKGLLSVDAIGSGDYRYVNELLIFAASLHGQELAPSEFHPLNNICELNMNDEPHKFYWEPYGAAFSKIAGLRGLAQLSRWDDRQKISLSHTLLPSLIGLVKDKKLNSKDAIALNYLASPVEYRSAGTTEFVEALTLAGISSALEVREVIHQFMLNNSGVSMTSTVQSLAKLSEEVLGKQVQETTELNRAIPLYRELIDKGNRHSNLHSSIGDKKFLSKQESQKKKNERSIILKFKSINPVDKDSFKASLKFLNQLDDPYNLKNFYFSHLKKKVTYSNRQKYIENLASLEDGEFHWYWIVDELNKCHDAWASSSISLKEVFKKAGFALLHQHSIHFISSDYLSRSDLSNISKFSGIPVSDLALELVKIGAKHNVSVSGAVWLSFATLLNENACDDIGQASLKKLLLSESASLGNLASDGGYKNGLYPDNNDNKIIANLTWKVLGSFDAKERWRAAHAIKCFAKFDRWEVISELVSMISIRDAGAFQVSDIKFYDYHAQLWLLISLARLSMDYPLKVSEYKIQIEPYTKTNHVLLRDFAAKILLECHKANSSFLTPVEFNFLNEINRSQFQIAEESKSRRNSYQGRPDNIPAPAHKFSLDYDFRKMEVDTLGDVFNIDCWQMDDFIAESAQEIDSSISSYHENGGKTIYRQYDRSRDSNQQTYGEQVAWHALHITAGKLLTKYPVTEDSWRGNTWEYWLSRHKLSREDGFWLSDTQDLIPLDIKSLLLEEKEKKLEITEDKNIMLGLANLSNKLSKDIVIDGHWTSKDGIKVEISSALVPKECSKKSATSLSKEDPWQLWLPDLEEDGEGCGFDDEGKYNLIPWIVSAKSYAKLDEFDPYRADIWSERSKLSKNIIDAYHLKCTDRFSRFWHDKDENLILTSEVWKGPKNSNRDGEYSGLRLKCSSNFIKELLQDCDSNLILLIRLQRYQEGIHRGSSGTFSHSIAIVEIDEKFEIKYRKGFNKDKPTV